MSRAAKALGARLSWEETLTPLMRWLQNPQVAVDRRPGAHTGRSDGSTTDRLGGRLRLHLDDGGVAKVAKVGWQAGRRKLGK